MGASAEETAEDYICYAGGVVKQATGAIINATTILLTLPSPKDISSTTIPDGGCKKGGIEIKQVYATGGDRIRKPPTKYLEELIG